MNISPTSVTGGTNPYGWFFQHFAVRDDNEVLALNKGLTWTFDAGTTELQMSNTGPTHRDWPLVSGKDTTSGTATITASDGTNTVSATITIGA